MIKELFTPLQIGPMTIRNRIMMSAMSAGMLITHDGEISEATVAYYAERARTSPGMMAIGAGGVLPPEGPPGSVSMRSSWGLRLWSDEMIPKLRRFVDRMHAFDTKFGIQLFNLGGTERGRQTVISPSGLPANVRVSREPSRRARVQPNRAIKLEEIAGIVEQFASAADRCRAAGFDFVELHAGHGYLISNFMTPLFNRREDRYGGSFENRTRFLLEVVSAIKQRIGNSIALGVKFNGDDFIGPDGWTIEESRRLAPLIEAAGADYLTITAGLIGSDRLTIPPLYEPQACYADMAASIKPLVSIPVASVGRIKSPLVARDLIREGKVDFVVMGRAFIADPEFVEKVRTERIEEIRPCLADCRGCADEHLQRGGMTSCVVNPRMCRELDLVDVEGRAREHPKKVLVIGGGLAGLEAARQCSFSGHRVTLCEANEALGGQIRLAAAIPGRHELGDILPWYENQLRKYGVDVRLGTQADESLLQSLKPDVLFVASGSLPSVPSNMVDFAMSAENVQVLLVDEALECVEDLGKRVLVIGGDQVGVAAADRFASAGREVWVAEAGQHFGAKLAAHDRWYLLNRLNEKGVVRIKEVTGMRLDVQERVVVLKADGEQQLPPVDTIVFASERHADGSMLETAKRLGIESYAVGEARDATSDMAGTIFASIAQAYDLARLI